MFCKVFFYNAPPSLRKRRISPRIVIPAKVEIKYFQLVTYYDSRLRGNDDFAGMTIFYENILMEDTYDIRIWDFSCSALDKP